MGCLSIRTAGSIEAISSSSSVRGTVIARGGRGGGGGQRANGARTAVWAYFLPISPYLPARQPPDDLIND